jgi:hypothetical protein
MATRRDAELMAQLGLRKRCGLGFGYRRRDWQDLVRRGSRSLAANRLSCRGGGDFMGFLRRFLPHPLHAVCVTEQNCCEATWQSI